MLNNSPIQKLNTNLFNDPIQTIDRNPFSDPIQSSKIRPFGDLTQNSKTNLFGGPIDLNFKGPGFCFSNAQHPPMKANIPSPMIDILVPKIIPVATNTNSTTQQKNDPVKIIPDSLKHVKRQLSLLHVFAFIREIFDDSTVKHIIDDDKQSADRYRSLRGSFLAAVVANKPNDCLDCYFDIYRHSIEASANNGCYFLQIIYKNNEPEFKTSQFNTFLDKLVTDLVRKYHENTTGKIELVENSEVKTEEDASTANDTVINIAKILGLDYQVYHRRDVISRSVTVYHDYGDSLTCTFVGTPAELDLLTFDDLRSKIDTNIRYAYLFASESNIYPGRVPTYSACANSAAGVVIGPPGSSNKKLDLYLGMHEFLSESARLFDPARNKREKVMLAQMRPNMEGFEDMCPTMDRGSLVTYLFAVNGIQSPVYFTFKCLGVMTICPVMTSEIKKLVADQDKEKASCLVESMLKKSSQIYLVNNTNAKFSEDFDLGCALPSTATYRNMQTPQQLLSQLTVPITSATGQSNHQPCIIAISDSCKQPSKDGHQSLASIFGKKTEFIDARDQYQLAFELSIGEQSDKTSMVYYELTTSQPHVKNAL